MSFFVSEALRGRVTEEDILEDKPSGKRKDELVLDLFVRASFSSGESHDFEFVKFSKKEKVATLTFEVPLTYRFLSLLLTERVHLKLFNSFFDVLKYEGHINNFELVRQNERNCYLLKIVIDD